MRERSIGNQYGIPIEGPDEADVSIEGPQSHARPNQCSCHIDKTRTTTTPSCPTYSPSAKRISIPPTTPRRENDGKGPGSRHATGVHHSNRVLSPPAHTTPIPIAATSAAHMMTRRPARRPVRKPVRKAVRRAERGWGCVPFTRAAYPKPWYPAPRGTHSQAILGLDTDVHRGPAGRGVGGEYEGVG